MTIAESGQRKTAIENLAFVALREAHAARWLAHQKRLRAWEALSAKARKETQKPAEPHSFLVEDVTPEKLQMIFAATDRGTLMVRDEMAGLLEFGRYASKSGAAERAFYLQAYEAGSYTVSRVTRDSLHINVNGLTIYGSIQPDRLKDFPDLQKTAFCSASTQSAHRPLLQAKMMWSCRMPIASTKPSPHSLAKFIGATERPLTAARSSDRPNRTDVSSPPYPITARVFRALAANSTEPDARYALVLHLLDNPGVPIIPSATVQRADIFIRKFPAAAGRDFFANLSGSFHQRRRDVAGWILTKAQPRFLASDLMAGVGACRGMGTKEINELLDPLVTGGWIEPEVPFPNNRAWTVTPTYARLSPIA